MKIVHLYKSYFPDQTGGVPEVIRQISQFTSKAGYYNTICTVAKINKKTTEKLSEATLIRYPEDFFKASTPVSFSLMKDFSSIAKQHDVLHFHFPYPVTETMYAISQLKKPSIVTYHSDVVKQKTILKLYKPIMKRFLNKVDVIVPTSDNYLKSSPYLQEYQDKCNVIPLFLGNERFKNSDEKLINKVKNKHGDNFYLFVGVLRYYKGLQYLIPAMKGINSKLVIVGSGPELEDLKRIADENKISNVYFEGFVEDKLLPAYYQLCKAFILPSCQRSEAFGVSIMEALSYGKPIISTELRTGTSFVNLDGVTGLVVPPEDIGSLKVAINKFENDHDLYNLFEINAKKRFHELFTDEVNGKKYIEIYERIVK